MSKDIAIDMGTANTRVFVKEKSNFIQEPTVVGINAITDEILAVGTEAKVMLGKTPENILAIKPIRSGVISDFYATKAMLEWCINNACEKTMFGKNRILLCVPDCITDVEQRAIEEATYLAGAKEVYLIPNIIAAAIGSGIKMDEIKGNMILDIGAGKTEAAVISQGGIVSSYTLRAGGDDIDKDIVEYIKEKYDILIGENAAEEIKSTIGAADASMTVEHTKIKGRNIATGLPDVVTVTNNDIAMASQRVLDEILKCINRVLEQTPPELASDVLETGIVICGGGAYIRNIDRYILQKLNVQAYLAESPLECVIKGASVMSRNVELLKKSLRNKRR